VLATPVRSLGGAAAEIAPVLEPGALVIDVGSVKAAAIAAVEPKLPPGTFIACHPIAGTERVGPDAASGPHVKRLEPRLGPICVLVGDPKARRNIRRAPARHPESAIQNR